MSKGKHKATLPRQAALKKTLTVRPAVGLQEALFLGSYRALLLTFLLGGAFLFLSQTAFSFEVEVTPANPQMGSHWESSEVASTEIQALKKKHQCWDSSTPGDHPAPQKVLYSYFPSGPQIGGPELLHRALEQELGGENIEGFIVHAFCP